MGTPIWNIEGKALNSEGSLVTGSLGGLVINVESETNKIDSAVTDGLLGTGNSLAYRVHEIEKHFHSSERWWGAVAAPDETNAIESNVDDPFVAASGDNTWGTAIPVVGTADIPSPTGTVKFDFHRLLVTDLDDDVTPWKIRLLYGTGTSAYAIAEEQYTETMVVANAVPGNRAGGTPIDVQMPRINVGSKIWAQAWNDTLNEELSFFIGVHGYVG